MSAGENTSGTSALEEGVVDCGVVQRPSEGSLASYVDAGETEEALACFGENYFDDCSAARMRWPDEDYVPMDFEVRMVNSTCYTGWLFPGEDVLPEHEARFANQELWCPMTTIFSGEPPTNRTPTQLGFSTGFGMGVMMFGEPPAECYGSITESYEELIGT